MSEGITVLIPNEGLFEARMRLAIQDARSLVKHGQVRVTVGQYVPRGTLEQNALFHLLCTHIAEWWNARHPEQPTGMEAVKRDLKVQYGVISTEYSPVSDKRHARLASWSEYNRKQRADLITATLAYMAENGIPDLPEIPAKEYAMYREARVA